MCYHSNVRINGGICAHWPISPLLWMKAFRRSTNIRSTTSSSESVSQMIQNNNSEEHLKVCLKRNSDCPRFDQPWFRKYFPVCFLHRHFRSFLKKIQSHESKLALRLFTILQFDLDPKKKKKKRKLYLQIAKLQKIFELLRRPNYVICNALREWAVTIPVSMVTSLTSVSLGNGVLHHVILKSCWKLLLVLFLSQGHLKN